jgi:HlyD family secretion protein
MLLVLIAVAGSVAAGAGMYHYLHNDDDRLLAYGAVEATEIQLGFQAPGRIQTLATREGDKVTPDQILAKLDTEETEARLAQARAQVHSVKLRMADAKRDLQRNTALFEGGAIGQEALDKSIFAVEVARSEYRQAQAAARALEAVLENMTIKASLPGIVTVRHREPGETVQAGTPVLTVMNPDDRWVRIYIPENRIGAVQLQQRAAIKTDTWPEKQYSGEVFYIASEAEFTPKNVQTAEERVNLVYAVKVRITDDPRFELKPGMPADVYFEQGVRQ